MSRGSTDPFHTDTANVVAASASPHHEDRHRTSVQGALGDAPQQEVPHATDTTRTDDEQIGA